MFLSVTQWSDRCVPWQILFVGVFVWALAPFVCLVCCSSLTKRKSGWGICGSSGWFVWFLVCCDLPAFPDLLGLCTNDVFTAYAHVRTEPQCDTGHTRGKKRKKMCSCFVCAFDLPSYMTTGVHVDVTREALLSEVGFEKVFRTQNWVGRSKLFCR